MHVYHKILVRANILSMYDIANISDEYGYSKYIIRTFEPKFYMHRSMLC